MTKEEEVAVKLAERLLAEVNRRLPQHKKAAKNFAIRHSIYGYSGALGAFSTAALSKLSASTLVFGLVGAGDLVFGMGLFTALASVLAAQGLTAKRTETHIAAAVKLESMKFELERIITILPIATAKELKETRTRLLALEHQLPVSGEYEVGVAPVPSRVSV